MVNDNYGHNVGDEILKQFVRVIKDNCRINDSLVRWGGEEFLLFCAETKIESAAIISEKIRKAIEASTWPNAINLTCRLGVVEKKQEVEEDFQTLIERAYRALYRAKHLGRNRSERVA
ncbi:MAG: diguanylate cyclase (GGDEF)-like protein [Colwellia sp.]|jgi:diguanylate cyclase (GGDEF)-like protein